MSLENGIGTKAYELPPKVEESLQKLREMQPPVSIDFYFSKHDSYKDAAGLREKAKNNDIYLPENCGWESAQLTYFNKAAQGDTSMTNRCSEHTRGVGDAIRSTNIAIGFIDYPAYYSALLDNMDRRIKNSYFENLTYESKAKSMKSDLMASAEFHKNREDYMITQLPQRIAEIVEKKPELKQKEELRILISLGSYHTRVFHILKSAGIRTTRSFSKPYTYSINCETLRDLTMNNGTLDEKMIAENVLEDMIPMEIYKESGIRSLAAKFSHEEIEQLYEQQIKKSGEEKKELIINKVREKENSPEEKFIYELAA